MTDQLTDTSSTDATETRHAVDVYYVEGEGFLGMDTEADMQGWSAAQVTYSSAAIAPRRFTRLVPKDPSAPTAQPQLNTDTLKKIAEAMTKASRVESDIPAGYTYLGQFTDHDLTRNSQTANLGAREIEITQERSPDLDLDSVYGDGDPDPERFYDSHDPAKLKIGTTKGSDVPEGDPVAWNDLPGFDLPRTGVFAPTDSIRDNRKALIPEPRNDENLIVAQIHAAFIRFHNHVADTLVARTGDPHRRRAKAREEVTKHYQWMVRHDFLPRVIDPDILDTEFTQTGRTGSFTMPLEFSVAAYRFGHSMIRGDYDWNRIFTPNGPVEEAGKSVTGTLKLLFNFTGTSGTLSSNNPSPKNPQQEGTNIQLPTNWVADYRRLFNFPAAGYLEPFFHIPRHNLNFAHRIGAAVADPLADLPLGSFTAGTDKPTDEFELNLAFRNLARARALRLATGQQAVSHYTKSKEQRISVLDKKQILTSPAENGTRPGVDFTAVLTTEEQKQLTEHTPLWLYILREAEWNPQHPGRLTGVGGRIVAEVFRQAIAVAEYSILADPTWKPTLGRTPGHFTMPDLLYCAADKTPHKLSPLLDLPPTYP